MAGVRPCPSTPVPRYQLCWAGTYFGSSPGWCLGSGAQEQSQGDPGSSQPHLLVNCNAKEAQDRDCLGALLGMGEQRHRGLGLGEEQERLAWGWQEAEGLPGVLLPTPSPGGEMGKVDQGHPNPLPTPTGSGPISSQISGPISSPSPPKAAPSHPILKPFTCTGVSGSSPQPLTALMPSWNLPLSLPQQQNRCLTSHGYL